MANTAIASLVRPLERNRDLALVVAVLGILIAILVPLPTAVMDVFLAINITFSLLILLTTIYVREPLDFSVFPSLLLVVTLYRLALNIATTRLILGGAGQDKTYAAGKVIFVFGNFVTGNNAIVGFIIFCVIVVIQFVVITKGASRIAEVAARFTLDKMPGQQLSIDADLNAGLIDEETAKGRRDRINREADFYGAMDGASKFVRGDAIAGIIITLINIIGGLIIGVTINGWSFQEAVKTFTLLTIGDGLVSQIPALVVSIAAGLIVTRTATETTLGSDLVTQLFSNPRAIAITAGFLLVLVPIGLPPVVLVMGALLFGGIAYLIVLRQREAEVGRQEEPVAEAPSQPTEMSLPPIDPLELEVGYGLVTLVDPGDRGGLLQRIGLIREQIASELGIVIPPVRIRDNMQFKPNTYSIKLRGEPIAGGSVMVDHSLAMDAGLGLETIDGIPTKEPAFGIDAVWITEENKGRVEALGYTVVDPTSVLATHLTEVIRDHAAELLTREEVKQLVDRVREESPAVVAEVIPDLLKLGEVQKVLQALLREKVMVRDLEGILECLADWAPRTKDPEILSEYVRHSLGRSICRTYADDEGRLHVITLDPKLEEYITNATEHGDRGSFLRLSPDMVSPLVQCISKALGRLISAGHPPIVLTAPQVRLQVRRMLENPVPGVVVLSYNEVARGAAVESAGVARMN
ncbi:MAG: flagellar biosynthesis protein FlhA [Planctomycetota bacterium]